MGSIDFLSYHFDGSRVLAVAGQQIRIINYRC